MGFKVTVELPLFLCFFGFMLSGPLYTNLVIYRTCYITLGYNKTDCAQLGLNPNNVTEHLEKLVEPTVNLFNSVKSTVESIFTVIILIFIGPWTDRFGRKPVILTSIAGFVVSSFLAIAYSYLEISPWYLIICSIPIVLTGGAPAFITVILSYIADISTDDNRNIRMVTFEGIIAAGSLLGSLASSPLFYATSYETVFTIMTLCSCLSFIWVFFCVPESVLNVETENKLIGLFNITNFIDTVKTTIKPRENYQRAVILLSVAVLTIFIFTTNADSLMFLYLRTKLDWTLEKFTRLSSLGSIFGITGAVVGTIIFKKTLRASEAVTVLAGLISMFVGTTITGLANNDIMIYAAAGVKGLGGIVSPMVRSMVAKLAAPEELGKIFSVIMISEFSVGLAAGPLFNLIYSETIDINVGIFTYVAAGLYIVDTILIIIIIVLQQVPSRPNDPLLESLVAEDIDQGIN